MFPRFRLQVDTHSDLGWSEECRGTNFVRCLAFATRTAKADTTRTHASLFQLQSADMRMCVIVE